MEHHTRDIITVCNELITRGTDTVFYRMTCNKISAACTYKAPRLTPAHS